MAKLVRTFASKANARAWLDKAKQVRGIQGGNVYDCGGRYHAMLYGDITPAMVEQLRGPKGSRYEYTI